MTRKGYAKMDHTVFYAEQGSLAQFGSPDAGWYWDYAGADEPNPHGPFPTYDAALSDKRAALDMNFSAGITGKAERAYYHDEPPF